MSALSCVQDLLYVGHAHARLLHYSFEYLLYNDALSVIWVTCPEAKMRLSAMVLYEIRSRDYPSSE